MLKQGTEAFDWACRKHGGPQPQPRRENDAQREEQKTPGSRNPDGINRTPGGARQTETSAGALGAPIGAGAASARRRSAARAWWLRSKTESS